MDNNDKKNMIYMKMIMTRRNKKQRPKPQPPEEEKDAELRPQQPQTSIADIYIGTAGYSYSHWRNGVFYPSGTTQANELRHYSGVFNAVEINASFHAVPREETLRAWVAKAKPGFQFSFKVPQIITHEKRLEHIDSDLKFFLNRLQAAFLNDGDGTNNNANIRPLLGPVLFQLPPSLYKNVRKLDEIATLLKPYDNNTIKVAFEFRNKTWYCQEVYDVMARHDFGLCENISPDNSTFHTTHVTTATKMAAAASSPSTSCSSSSCWHYIRCHKKQDRGVTNYTDLQLAKIADQLTGRRRQGIVQYCYFLNDHEGNGPRNAKSLTKAIQQCVPGPLIVQQREGGWKPDPTESSIRSLFDRAKHNTSNNNSNKLTKITSSIVARSSASKSGTTTTNRTTTTTNKNTIQSFFGSSAASSLPPSKRPKTMTATTTTTMTMHNNNINGVIDLTGGGDSSPTKKIPPPAISPKTKNKRGSITNFFSKKNK